MNSEGECIDSQYMKSISEEEDWQTRRAKSKRAISFFFSIYSMYWGGIVL